MFLVQVCLDICHPLPLRCEQEGELVAVHISRQRSSALRLQLLERNIYPSFNLHAFLIAKTSSDTGDSLYFIYSTSLYLFPVLMNFRQLRPTSLTKLFESTTSDTLPILTPYASSTWDVAPQGHARRLIHGRIPSATSQSSSELALTLLTPVHTQVPH